MTADRLLELWNEFAHETSLCFWHDREVCPMRMIGEPAFNAAACERAPGFDPGAPFFRFREDGKIESLRCPVLAWGPFMDYMRRRNR